MADALHGFAKTNHADSGVVFVAGANLDKVNPVRGVMKDRFDIIEDQSGSVVWGDIVYGRRTPYHT